VANQYRPLANRSAHGSTDWREYVIQCGTLTERIAERMIRIDSCDFEGFRVDIGAGKRLDMRGNRRVWIYEAAFVHTNDRHRNFEQGIALAIEAAGFHIDDDRQESAKSLGDARIGQ
jgi:hypothetical protein